MKVTLLSITLFIFTIFTSSHLLAGNPGQSAMGCVNASSSGDNINFKNSCSYQIFIVWCGDLKYNKKRCGDGNNGEYYTHSANIDGYDSYDVAIDGRYNYAACRGSISFGRDGIKDFSDGSFECTPTGSYR